MRVIDYTRIAETYDELPIRREVPPEPLLEELARERRVRVLDVGCGTGSWLVAQARAFGERVELAGVDPSSAMLARAKEKMPHVPLSVASAESLPFADATFELVVTRFAFHHFTDKPRALDELTRLVAPGGALFLMNIAPERMPGFWVFARFPEARAENVRYWEATRIESELAQRGLEVQLTIEERRGEITLAEALSRAHTRDQSHLVAIDDDAYERGLRALEREHLAAANGSIATESAVARLIARRRA